MAEVRFLPPAAKYLKKLKDKRLKELYKVAIDAICKDIYYNKTNYELAYTVEYEGEKIIVVVMAGTRENFYDELKRYMK